MGVQRFSQRIRFRFVHSYGSQSAAPCLERFANVIELGDIIGIQGDDPSPGIGLECQKCRKTTFCEWLREPVRG